MAILFIVLGHSPLWAQAGITDSDSINWKKNYDLYRPAGEGRICVRQNKLWGFVNEQGKVLGAIRYDNVGEYSCGRAKVKRKGKWGYLNREGKEIIPVKYDKAGDFINGRALVIMGEYASTIDTMNNIVDRESFPDSVENRKPQAMPGGRQAWRAGYELTGLCRDGRISVRKGKKCGFADTNGHIVVPLIYDDAWEYSEGMARVKSGKLWGYIDTNGKLVIPFKYRFALDFINGRAKVGQKDGWFFIDRQGEEIKEEKK